MTNSRAQILAAATREFADRGYAGATTASVARRAGVTQPLVHHYFGSKQGLWDDALAELFGALGAAMEEAKVQMQGMASAARIAHLLRSLVRFNGQRPELSRLIRTEGTVGGPAFAELFDTWLVGPLRFLEKEIAEGVNDGTFRALPPGLAYFVLTGAATQAFAQPEAAKRAFQLDMTDPETMERYADTVVTLLLRGLLKVPDP